MADHVELYKVNVVVFVLLYRMKNGKCEILLQRRKNTSYMPGMYDFSASGKINYDEGEIESAERAVIREAKEEIGVDINPIDLQFFHTRHDTAENHIKLFFATSKWTVDGEENGEPKICEPDKCDNLLWSLYDNPPDNLIPFLKKVLIHGLHHKHYSDDLSPNAR